MTPLSEMPINSIAWFFGTIACLMLGTKGLVSYRHSFNKLSKYIGWFGIVMGLALACFSISVFFTTNTDDLRIVWIIGELLVYLSLIWQAAIMWTLVLRTKVPIYAVTIPTGLIGLAAWLNSAPKITLKLEDNFMSYSEPRISAMAFALLLIVLFSPVGFHFIRATRRQDGLKARLTTFVLGMVYLCVGLLTAAHLIIIGQVASATSSYGNIVFFIFLIGVIAWPRHAKIQPPTTPPPTATNYTQPNY